MWPFLPPERRPVGRGWQGGRQSGHSEGLPDTFLPSVPGWSAGSAPQGTGWFFGLPFCLWGCRDHPDRGGALSISGQSQGSEAGGARSGCWERVHTAGGCFLKWL